MKTPTLATDIHETKVIFRKWRKRQGGGIIALFPQVPSDVYGDYVSSYEHIGQHASATPRLMGDTLPATPEEYAPLHAELSRIGYKLTIGYKFTAKDEAIRRAALKR